MRDTSFASGCESCEADSCRARISGHHLLHSSCSLDGGTLPRFRSALDVTETTFRLLNWSASCNGSLRVYGTLLIRLSRRFERG